MRVIIKNADFSSVSIGKVTKDLSFEYVGASAIRNFPWVNGPSADTELPWNDGMFSSTSYLTATSSSESYTQTTNEHRLVSDYIEVSEGMVISTDLPNSYTVPSITCYDENKNPLGPSSAYTVWTPWHTDGALTVPAGVKYIRICTERISEDTATYTKYLKAEMPND